MRIYRSWAPEGDGAVVRLPAGRENLGGRRPELAEAAGPPRCPRCGEVLVARMRRGAPGIVCRCPVRRVRALPLPA
jgi:hypothetical protein